MEIPLEAQVEYSDGVVWHSIGRSVCVLVNPVSEKVTHLVVKEDASPNTEYIVPVEFVTETISDTIRLSCNKDKFEMMDKFVKTQYIDKKVPEMVVGYGSEMAGVGSYFYSPYVIPETTVQMPVEHLQIPPGELAVRRGTRVEATDGFVGKVDEFIVNPKNGHITHLVMREGHLWGKKDVIIPLSAMGDTHKDTVFLKLDKHQIESLPTFLLHRLWP
jgi:sporulation protein YlmC with PRC-barrel domain